MSYKLSVDSLERRADDERRRLQRTFESLRHTVQETLDVKHNAREFFWAASATATVIGLVLGYTLAGVFTRD